MESLLSTLCDITPYTTKQGFAHLCWHSLSTVISSREADKWTADQRGHFMVFTQFFLTCGEAVFTIKDALVRDGVTDLNGKLITELVEPLDRLEEFASSVELKELNETIDEYTEILLNIETRMRDAEITEFAANHFKFFFRTVYSLNIEERTNSGRLINHH
jgi:hypothetical protein